MSDLNVMRRDVERWSAYVTQHINELSELVEELLSKCEENNVLWRNSKNL